MLPAGAFAFGLSDGDFGTVVFAALFATGSFFGFGVSFGRFEADDLGLP